MCTLIANFKLFPIYLNPLWTEVNDIFTVYRERNNNNNNNTIDALASVLNAFNNSYNYLRNNNVQYIPNMELAGLWRDAFIAVMSIETNLGYILGRKSRFWAHPDIFIQLNNC